RKISAAKFLKYENQLGLPFGILVDTNFVNFAVKNRLVVIQGFRGWAVFTLTVFTVDVFISAIPYVTDCVMGELEKAGRRFKIALKVVKNIRFQHLRCDHKVIYADESLVQQVTPFCSTFYIRLFIT
ncbi:unnamed protein product, partial [Angiostrongylus costaricensis]|uniref:DDE_Tnp_1_7 domain-containing protein n=1 Tax=Angiostrongylus costaricensis TaxID=334426 RepID=A0A0R3PD28_ANGCS